MAFENNDEPTFDYLLKEGRGFLRNYILIGQSPLLREINNSNLPRYLRAIYINLDRADRNTLLYNLPLDVFGNNFIEFAIKKQNTAIFTEIIQLEVVHLITMKTSNGDNIIHLACKYSPTIACAILNEGHFKENHIRLLVNEFNNEMEQPLHIAVRQRELELVRQLAIKGANLEAEGRYNDNQLTPLLIAAMDMNMEMILKLVQRGANLSEGNVRKLFSFVKNNFPFRILKGLFKHGLVVPADVLNQFISPEDMKQILDDCINYDGFSQKIILTCEFSRNSFTDIQNFVSMSKVPSMKHLLKHPVIHLFIKVQYQLFKELHICEYESETDIMVMAQVILSVRSSQVNRISEVYVNATTGQVFTAPATLTNPIKCTHADVEQLKEMCRAKGEICTTKFASFAP